MALARMDASVDIDLDPSTMIGAGARLDPGEVSRPWASGTFRRLDTGSAGQLWVCKLGWWQGVPWDIKAYAKTHPSYPCEPTLQQLYDGSEFEAYRRLGPGAVGRGTRAAGLPHTAPA